jgi:hypothetical protein
VLAAHVERCERPARAGSSRSLVMLGDRSPHAARARVNEQPEAVVRVAIELDEVVSTAERAEVTIDELRPTTRELARRERSFTERVIERARGPSAANLSGDRRAHAVERALAACGDVMLIYFFDTPTVAHIKRVEAFARALIGELGSTIINAQIIAEGHSLPSREAQAWTVEMGSRLIADIRAIVAYPRGNSFRSIAVRSILRTVGMLIRARQRIVDSEGEMLDAISTASTRRCDARSQC